MGGPTGTASQVLARALAFEPADVSKRRVHLRKRLTWQLRSRVNWHRRRFLFQVLDQEGAAMLSL
jgi:hypothetical protein